MARSLIIVRWLGFQSLVLCAAIAARDSMAGVNWDPINDSMEFEDENNWDAQTYNPLPPAGNEEAPPGNDSRFIIGEANYTVILSDPRTGLSATEKLGTFTIGDGTFAADDPGTEDVETIGPGNEIMTFIIRNDVTFTSIERDDDGVVRDRPVRIGNNDRQPETRLNGELDFPWGIVLHQAGTFKLDSLSAAQDQVRIGMNQDLQGGSIFEVSGTGKLSLADKLRVGDRSTATSSANAVFRVRGSTMGTSTVIPAISLDDFEVESSIGLWDIDRPTEFENRLRFNRGKGILEFVLDDGGVTPLVIADDLRVGQQRTVPTTTPVNPDAGNLLYSPGFLRIKLSRPLLATTPGMAGQDPLLLIAADRISTSAPAIANPTPVQDEFLNGRFFDPDHSGPSIFPDADPEPDFSPHAFLSHNSQVIASYAGATYTWNIQYTDPINDNGVIDTFVRLTNGAVSGLIGDLNSDTLLNEGDRTALINAIATPPVTRYQMLGQAQNLFDLNADDFIDSLDLAVFNTYILPPTGVPGDYNDDGTVDAADYVIWRKGGPLQNEVVTQGSTTPEDYTEWRKRFGNGSPGAGGGSGNVPEPAAFVLTLSGVIALVLRRTRHIA